MGNAAYEKARAKFAKMREEAEREKRYMEANGIDPDEAKSMGAKVVEGLLNDASRNYMGTMNIENIEIRDIDRNDKNFYALNDIDKLKQSIETIGLKQPLLVKKQITGRYKLLAGERRFTAISELFEEGKWGPTVPCVLQDYDRINMPISDELKEMYVLITTNREQRKYTDMDIMNEIEELKVIYAALRDAGVDSFSLGSDEDGNEQVKQIKGVRTRDLVSEDLKMSPSQVGKYEKVEKKASEALREILEKQGININTAAKVADLPKEEQEELVEKYSSEDKKIQPQDVDDFIAEKKGDAEPEKKDVNDKPNLSVAPDEKIIAIRYEIAYREDADPGFYRSFKDMRDNLEEGNWINALNLLDIFRDALIDQINKEDEDIEI